MVNLENKIKLLSSKDEIILNENSYKIVDILNKLATLDEATKLEAIEEPVAKIVDLKIVDLNKDETKTLILEILNDKDLKSVLNFKYKTVDEMLKASVSQIKRGYFELPLSGFSGGISLGRSSNNELKISFDSTKAELEKTMQMKNDEIAKKIEDSRSKIDLIKKEIDDLKALQMKRIGFINKVEGLSVDNYYSNKEDLKNLLNELEK